MSKKDTGGKDCSDSESASLKAIDISDFDNASLSKSNSSDFDNASLSESNSLIHFSDFSDSSPSEIEIKKRIKRSNRLRSFELYSDDEKKASRLSRFKLRKKIEERRNSISSSEDDINIRPRREGKPVVALKDNKKFEKPKTKFENFVALKSSQGPSIQKDSLSTFDSAFADLKKVVEEMDKMVNDELTSLKQEGLEFLLEEELEFLLEEDLQAQNYFENPDQTFIKDFYEELDELEKFINFLGKNSEEDSKTDEAANPENGKIFRSEIIRLNESLKKSYPDFIRLLEIIRKQTKKIENNDARIAALKLEADNAGIVRSEIKKHKVSNRLKLVKFGNKNEDGVNASLEKTSSVQNGDLSIAFPEFGDLKKVVEEMDKMVNDELTSLKQEELEFLLEEDSRAQNSFENLDQKFIKDFHEELDKLEEFINSLGKNSEEDSKTDKAENPENGKIFLSAIKFLTQNFKNIQSNFGELLEIMHEQTEEIKDGDTLIAELKKKIDDACIAELKKELNNDDIKIESDSPSSNIEVIITLVNDQAKEDEEKTNENNSSMSNLITSISLQIKKLEALLISILFDRNQEFDQNLDVPLKELLKKVENLSNYKPEEINSTLSPEEITEFTGNIKNLGNRIRRTILTNDLTKRNDHINHIDWEPNSKFVESEDSELEGPESEEPSNETHEPLSSQLINADYLLDTTITLIDKIDTTSNSSDKIISKSDFLADEIKSESSEKISAHDILKIIQDNMEKMISALSVNFVEAKKNKTEIEKEVQKIITLVNENAKKNEKKTEIFQAKDWFNNKKLLRALKKVANCNFEKLKTALNSNEDIRDKQFLTELKLTSGDLSVLDAIDELYDTKRAKEKFSVENRNVDRKNLEMMINLIPKDETKRKEFFKFEKEQNFDLNITPNISASATKAQSFLQKINEVTRNNEKNSR